MKIEGPLTLSSLKDNFSHLVEELKLQTEIEVTTETIDTSGIQFLINLKKNNPALKIHLISKKSQEWAKILGADTCL